jgi:bla regulator protein blaR1
MTPLTAIGAHLWQSTLFAAAVSLVTLTLRKNRAAIRHALWLAASVKFLVPFAALTALGAEFGPRLPAVVTTAELILNFDGSGQGIMSGPSVVAPAHAARSLMLPSPSIVGPLWLGGVIFVLAVWWMRWRRVAAIAREGTAVEAGRVVDALRRLERAVGITKPIRLIESTGSLEPGVFGLVRPVLVWPRTIGDRLDENQVVAILAHELSHVQRRDNLTAAIHMIVESIFWFHPLVWWLGVRLVDERERACDEAVLRLGSEPQEYAETILKACRIFLESPLACVSGVTGSDLRKRIERIMMNGSSSALTPMKKVFVAAVPVVALVAPIVIGFRNGPRLRAESRRVTILAPAPIQGRGEFEVASVKPNKSGIAKVMIQTQPGGRFTAENVTLRSLILFAYRLQQPQLTGGPSWLDSDRFDIIAKGGDESGDLFDADRRGETSRVHLMLRTLLAQRFTLGVHTEGRELPIYALVRARSDGKLGPELRPSTLDCTAAAARGALPPPGSASCGIRIGGAPGTMVAGGASIAQLANTLTNWVGRVVFDRTGLSGDFDFTLKWTPDQMPDGFGKKVAAGGLAPADPNGPSIFTALQEQLGLKLDSQRGPVDVLVIDRAEHPVEN